MNQNLKSWVLDLFNQAQTGKIVLGEEESAWTFFVGFNTSLAKPKASANADFAYIDIPNLDLLVKKLQTYLNRAKEFYKGDEQYFMLDNNPKAFAQKLILDILISCSPSDCNNIYNYIDMRTRMLESNVELGQKIVGKYDEIIIKADISKNTKGKASFEGPYTFTPILEHNSKCIVLPSVIFGIDDKIVHLYAIQNSQSPDKTNPLAKTLDRHFRKVNSGVEENLNIAKVSPNALVSFTIFAKYAENRGKTQVVSPSYMPLRYMGNLAAHKNKQKETEDNSLVENHDCIQYNITNKLMNTLFRYAHHFKNSKCFHDQDEFSTYLQVDSTPKKESNNIIYDISNSVGKLIQPER